MKPGGIQLASVAIALALGPVLGQPPFPSQPEDSLPGPGPGLAAVGVALPPAPPPEMPPRPPSPVAVFRQLLKSSPEAQQSVLASRSPKQRAYLETQIQAFAGLSSAEREARLRLVELRFYLLPLLRTPASNRAEQLQSVPPRYRAAVRDRLSAWDALSPLEREGLLDDHAAASWLCRSPAGQPAGAEALPRPGSAEPAHLDRTLARWQGMSAAEKGRMVESLERFFQFNASQKDRTLREMARVGRPQMADFMTQLDRLPAAEREECLRALARFAGMPESERQRFLQNALRWAAMTDEDRRAWRNLQTKLPPLPPPVPPRPPLAQARP